MAEILRSKFGIQELDKALGGGIPQNNIVLLAGGAGTGKSTLALQYAINGATLFGEKCLYVSTEQNEKELLKVANSFGWKLEELQKSNLIRIRFLNILKGDSFLETIKNECADFAPKRIIIDSLTTLTDSLLMSDNGDVSFSMIKVAETVNPVPRTERALVKTALYHLIGLLKEVNATSILTTELPEETHFLSADEVSEFICDGVIALHRLAIGSAVRRTLMIHKMRYTNHSDESLNLDFDSSGVSISEEKTI